MADLQELNAGGIREIRQVDPSGFTIVTTDDKLYRITLPDGIVGPQGPKGDQGPRGERGEMGSPGADGLDGRDGLNGNDGRDGNGVQFAQVLKDGNLVLMLTSGDVINCGKVVGPAGPQGIPGRAGVPGPAGADGNRVYTGENPPPAELGEDGDVYIDVRNWKLYTKSSLSWGTGNSMVPNAKTLDQAIRSFNSGGGGSNRIFGMGAPSSGIAVSSGKGGGLDEILGNKLPLAKDTETLIATDSGDLIKVILYMRTTDGKVYSTEVVAMRTATTAAWTSAWEMAVPTTGIPNVDFIAKLNGANLELKVVSDGAWAEIRGAVIRI